MTGVVQPVVDGPARDCRATPARLTGLTVAVAFAVVAVDQLTKRWAVDRLSDGRDVDLVWTLRLHLAFNSGMAFSQGRGLGPVIGVVALVVVVALLVSLRRGGSTLAAVSVGLVVGGAAGNVADRLFRTGGGGFLSGAVVDFIDLQWWPVFNVADACIVVGGLLLAASSLRAAPRRP
jgi:signal peptidase II